MTTKRTMRMIALSGIFIALVLGLFLVLLVITKPNNVWYKVRSNNLCLNGEKQLDFFRSFDSEAKSMVKPIFYQDKRITIFHDCRRNKIMKSIDLPGELVDYKSTTYGRNLFLLVTVKTNPATLLVYESVDEKVGFKKKFELATECVYFRSNFSTNYFNNQSEFALQSYDRKRLQILNVEGELLKDIRREKPFVEADNPNMVFDGASIYNILDPSDSVDIDYSKVNFKPDKFDFSKPLWIDNDAIYNNNYFLVFEENTKVVKSIQMLPDITMIYKEPDLTHNSVRFNNGFIYISNKGIFRYKDTFSKQIINVYNLKFELELDPSFYNVYSAVVDNSSRIITIKRNFDKK